MGTATAFAAVAIALTARPKPKRAAVASLRMYNAPVVAATIGKFLTRSGPLREARCIIGLSGESLPPAPCEEAAEGHHEAGKASADNGAWDCGGRGLQRN